MRFSGQRYWLPLMSAGSADISGVGLLVARHGLLRGRGATGFDVVVLTGRLSVGSGGWPITWTLEWCCSAVRLSGRR